MGFRKGSSGHRLRELAARLDRSPGGGRRFWRSLDELAETEEFQRYLDAEFPAAAPLLTEATRRDVLRTMAASLALAGLSGCEYRPDEHALPYVRAPEYMVPGESLYYATAFPLGGYALPILAETHMGRPIKVEGNPDHPLTRGATDIFSQASVLGLYDPERSQAITHLNRISTWNAFQTAMLEATAGLAARRGEGLAVLTGTVTSPTLYRQIVQLRRRFPGLRWYVHEPVGPQLRHAATRLAFGEPLAVHYLFDEAAVVLSLDDDFLGPGPAQMPNARRWVRGRRDGLERGEVLTLHVAEPTPSLTGAKATSRLRLNPTEVPPLAAALARELGVGAAALDEVELPLARRAWLRQVADELRRHRERAVVTVGAHLPADVQALGLLINRELGGLGRTVVLTDPVEAEAGEPERTLADLAEAIAAGEVEALFILDSNPAYTAPADLDFQELLLRVPLRVHVGQRSNETAELCHWHVPLHHPFETWSDARAVDGTATVIQPLLRPLYGGRSVHEVLGLLNGELDPSAHEAVRITWREILDLDGDGFEEAWLKILHDGYVPGTAAEPRRVPAARPVELAVHEPAAGDALEFVFRPDPSIWDGRFANNPWLQELPKPLTKLTWDNVAAISPALADEMNVRDGSFVDVVVGDRRVPAPVWILPGQAERTVTLYLGYGRRRIGRVQGRTSDDAYIGDSVVDRVGYDAYALRQAADPWLVVGGALVPTGEATVLATTQHHATTAGREHIVRTATPEEVARGEDLYHREERSLLYPKWEYRGYAWGMVIDLDACIGCNACVVACMAENNVPVVGKDQVAMGRNMHWLRVDRYYEGDPANPRTYFQPLPCMHCEKAPCEVGCPVNATVHGPEGLNQMIYNRCVGTRTCASYCPYKVRRFNFYDYTGKEPRGRIPQRNPEVTVRSRGVMEKCTYCVQRIAKAKIEARVENRPIYDGEVETACQSACPTRAIVFGDINDPDTLVSRAQRSPRNYQLLGELNTQPRTTYLAALEVPWPPVEGQGG